jgi:hypothetical protein
MAVSATATNVCLRFPRRRWTLARMTGNKALEALRRRLRHQLKDSTGEVAIAAADLRNVRDELGRLLQSNDRLRRQNRRVRLKLQRAGLDDAVDGVADGATDPADGDPGDEAPSSDGMV